MIDLRREVADLEAKENALDRLIHGAEKTLRELGAEKQFAYVTYHDLRSVAAYKDQAIMAVKAPPEATLHVPQPSNNFGLPKVYFHVEIVCIISIYFFYFYLLNTIVNEKYILIIHFQNANDSSLRTKILNNLTAKKDLVGFF